MSWRWLFGATCVLSIAAVGACGSQTFSSAEDQDGGASDASTFDSSVRDSGSPGDGAAAVDAGEDSGEDAGEDAGDSGLPAGTIVLANGQLNPHELVVKNGRLYWTNFSEAAATGSVCMMNIDGTGLVKLGDGVHANRIAVDDTQAFWSDYASPNVTGSRLNASPFDGGPTNVFADSIAPMGVAANTDSVFFVGFFGFPGSGAVLQFAKDGGQVANLSGLANAVSVSADDLGFAWTQFGASPPSGGSVITMDLDASPGPTSTGLSEPWAIALSGTNAYYTVVGSLDASAPGLVGVLDRTGDASPDTIASSTSRPYFITADATKVYWTEEGAGPANGLVRYALKSDKVAHDFAIGQERPHGIAVDASFIYWSSYTNGKIYRSPLPL